MDTNRVAAADPGEVYWREGPAPPGTKVLLRTVGGIAVIGQWSGEPGQFFTEWCPLPRRRKREGDLDAP